MDQQIWIQRKGCWAHMNTLSMLMLTHKAQWSRGGSVWFMQRHWPRRSLTQPGRDWRMSQACGHLAHHSLPVGESLKFHCQWGLGASAVICWHAFFDWNVCCSLATRRLPRQQIAAARTAYCFAAARTAYSNTLIQTLNPSLRPKTHCRQSEHSAGWHTTLTTPQSSIW